MILRRKKRYRIGRLALFIGYHICIVKARQLVDSAFKLISVEHDLTHALGLYTSAIEEFGKALLMKECYTPDETPKRVPRNIFEGQDAHKLKMKKALKNIPDICKQVRVGIYVPFPSGKPTTINLEQLGVTIKIPANTEGNFFSKYIINSQVRKNCFYVDWDEEQRRWMFNIKVNKDDLMNAMEEFKKHIEKYEYVTTAMPVK